MLIKIAPCLVGVLAILALSARARADAPAPAPPTDAELAGPLARTSLVRAAIARNPGVRAAQARAGATRSAADALGRLPPPELMLQVWQVPLARPYAVGDAQMVMVGLQQTFPAPGSQGAREEAKLAESRADEAGALARAREIARDTEHAYADYLQASARHRVHLDHLDVAHKVLDVARARYVARGSLSDVTQAEVDLARVQADVVTDANLVLTARARINALLGRDPGAPLGPPGEEEPGLPAWDTATLLAHAREGRPELRAAEAQERSADAEANAADHEAVWPDFTVAALFFAPTYPLPTTGYGVNASMTLPWLWGAARSRADADRKRAAAARVEIEAQRVPIDADVVGAEATAKSAALRLQVLTQRALPASERGLDAARDAYTSDRVDMATLLAAVRAVVDVKMDVADARGSLDHALADLDAAVGAPVPRKPLGALDESVLGEGGRRGP